MKSVQNDKTGLHDTVNVSADWRLVALNSALWLFVGFLAGLLVGGS